MIDTCFKCFIIMPFSKTMSHEEEYWDNHFKKFLKPLVEDVKNVAAFRSEPLRGDILKQIITDLITIPVVIADLTDLNSNVLWELGVRQSFKHGTITIAEDGTKLPFDIDKKGTLFYYPNDHIKNEEFRKKLKVAILDCIHNPQRPDSQVLDTISGRGTLFELLELERSIRKIDALSCEIKSNQEDFEFLIDSVKKKKNDDLRCFHLFFRTPALELLITTRYIKENLINYEFMEHCFEMLTFYNANFMKQSRTERDEWLLIKGNQKEFRERLQKTITDLVEIKRQLEAYL